MPRVARIVIENVPHHVTQRGSNRQDVFFVNEDRRVYLSLFKDRAEAYGLEVRGLPISECQLPIGGDCADGHGIYELPGNVPPRQRGLEDGVGRTVARG